MKRSRHQRHPNVVGRKRSHRRRPYSQQQPFFYGAGFCFSFTCERLQKRPAIDRSDQSIDHATRYKRTVSALIGGFARLPPPLGSTDGHIRDTKIETLVIGPFVRLVLLLFLLLFLLLLLLFMQLYLYYRFRR